MKAQLKFQKNATVSMLKDASVGKSFVFQGHRTSANSPFYRAGFKFMTNMAWVVLLSTIDPVPVTIITITELPENGYGLQNEPTSLADYFGLQQQLKGYRSVMEQALEALEMAYEGKCRLDTVPNALTVLREALGDEK